ncbi:karyopherin Kap95 [Protomyces lactucae-debilis]|uniref:Importin-95 n=1 Tax=Protomyces lactucae-debilis TaxID=2754530 RepID=A0A1Y2FQL6_PROLT|nr:karyopherin Kap95 [Protomyces lactucae-debilis]ORY86291.1 karyopherin Kap95 [Protomyces lactucae-debilis]
MDVGQLLSNTLSPDAQLRLSATEQLEAAARDHFDQYMMLLSTQLANEQAASHIRNASGLALKNALSAKDFRRREENQGKWQNLPEQTKAQIKQATLFTLNSNDSKAGQSAAQFIASIAAIELPLQQWPELMTSLVSNTAPESAQHVKQASLQAIGYVCETVDPEVLASQSNAILTAVVQGARKEEPSIAVRLAAISALYDSLEFVRENFEREGERNYIMQIVCEATQANDVKLQVAAFGCLVRIMQLYYNKMRFYMEKALFGLTVLGMKHSDESVALQAIEFWSTVCEEEIEVMMEAQEAQELGDQPERECFQFAKTALPEVLPVLLTLLCKQEDDAEEDDWNVAMGAANCLQLFAQCAEGVIVQPVLQFIESKVSSSNWKEREAAVMAFGSILEGPEPEMLKPLVAQVLSVLLNMMKDENLQVKDTTAWTLGRISDLVIGAVTVEVLPNIVGALLDGLRDHPRIRTNCCWALMNLSEQLDDPESTSSQMSPFYEPAFTALLGVAESNSNENNARTSAYEALSTMVSHASSEVLPLISKLSGVVLDRLQATVSMRANVLSTEEKVQFEELQSNLLSVLTSIIRRCGKDVVPISDRIMTILLELEQNQPKQSVVHEDVFIAVGALCLAVEAHFGIYLDAFAPFLYAALANHEEYALCGIAIGLIGDIARSLGEQVLPYGDNFMTHLLQNLQSPLLNRAAKPAILSAISDIALAINQEFSKYLDVVMQLLQQASSVTYTPESGYDMIDYVNGLREGIVEAYVGIVQALKGTPKAATLGPYVEHMFNFMATCLADEERTQALQRNVIGLIGDLAETFPGGQLKQPLSAEWVSGCLKASRAKGQPQATKEVAKWASEHVATATR